MRRPQPSLRDGSGADGRYPALKCRATIRRPSGTGAEAKRTPRLSLPGTHQRMQKRSRRVEGGEAHGDVDIPHVCKRSLTCLPRFADRLRSREANVCITIDCRRLSVFALYCALLWNHSFSPRRRANISPARYREPVTRTRSGCFRAAARAASVVTWFSQATWPP